MTQEIIQEEMPFAMVRGEAVTEPPKDLYIPPEAMEVFLDTFEGPLDLLLYLIRKQNLDILDIPVAEGSDSLFYLLIFFVILSEPMPKWNILFRCPVPPLISLPELSFSRGCGNIRDNEFVQFDQIRR